MKSVDNRTGNLKIGAIAETRRNLDSSARCWALRCSVGTLFGLIIASGLVAALIVPEVRAAREAARQQKCVNNLKLIGAALLNYHDVYGCFPSPYISDANGARMHSWRAAIHSFMVSSDFANRYNLGEAWNSPKNRALVGYGVHFECPDGNQRLGDGLTNYVMVVGSRATPNGDAWTARERFSGSIDTAIIIVEIAKSDILWTEPRDLVLSEMSFTINDTAMPCISSGHPNGAMVLFANGDVQFLDQSLTNEAIRQMLQP